MGSARLSVPLLQPWGSATNTKSRVVDDPRFSACCSQPFSGRPVQVTAHAGHRPADVARAREGDRDAFRALVERHSRYIFCLAQRITGSTEDAEDVVQETWLKAHNQLSRFEARADFRTWLHRICVNCSIDLIRARRHREDPHDPADLADGTARWARQRRTAGAGPPGRQRTDSGPRAAGADRADVARARALSRCGMSTACRSSEISSRLGLKTSATKHGIFRAVRKMRVALEPFVGQTTASAADTRGLKT